MKATDGRLKLNQSYKLVGVEYLGKYHPDSPSLPVMCCMNCDLPITNIAHVTGSVDGREYMIGLDCAATLTSITPSEIAQAKKELARKVKFMKWLATEMVCYIIHDGRAMLFDHDVTGEVDDWKVRRGAQWNCNPASFSLDPTKERKIVSTRQEPNKYLPEHMDTFFTIK